MPMRELSHWPLMHWVRHYNRSTLASDGLAALIVTLMLVPQSLAYAMLAGLPPEVGLYASIAPLLLYALLGTSRVLAVGPVAVVSLMTATAIGQHASPGSADYWAVAITLAFLSGGMLLIMGWLRLGFLAHFLSHPVMSGFISASALLIAASQFKTLLNLPLEGTHFFDLLLAMVQQISHAHLLSLAVGLAVLVYLGWSRRYLSGTLARLGVPIGWSQLLSKAAPVVAIIITTLLAWKFDWQQHGLRVVGAIPQGLPPLTLPIWDGSLWQSLFMPALLISIVGFVESVSVGQTLAAKRRQRIEPNQELIALGASNIGASLTGGFPVTGGFARSVVNFDAGAQTPAAGCFTALGIVLVSLLLTPLLATLPHVTLAATIIVAVLALVDWGMLQRTWRYSKADFFAVLATLLSTLIWGVEVGLVSGVSVSLALFLYHTSQPHIAEVGWVAGTESFRNIQRHHVTTSPLLLSLRVDESLYFANSRTLEDRINQAVAHHPQLRHIVLQCSAINAIDASALESLETINQRLHDAGILLHVSEVKGPVMDKLQHTRFLKKLSGKVYLTHYQAFKELAPATSYVVSHPQE